MGKYVLKRILIMIPTLLVVIFIIFALINIMPGDPGGSCWARMQHRRMWTPSMPCCGWISRWSYDISYIYGTHSILILVYRISRGSQYSLTFSQNTDYIYSRSRRNGHLRINWRSPGRYICCERTYTARFLPIGYLSAHCSHTELLDEHYDDSSFLCNAPPASLQRIGPPLHYVMPILSLCLGNALIISG